MVKRNITMDAAHDEGRGSSTETGLFSETILGTIVAWTDSRTPVVEYQSPAGEVRRHPALSTVRLDERATGHPVVLTFIRGDLERPVITGCLVPGVVTPPTTTRTKALTIDGRELVFEADAMLTLRCGRSSITLTRDGQITIRGTNVVSHASGVNRIRGGTINLN